MLSAQANPAANSASKLTSSKPHRVEENQIEPDDGEISQASTSAKQNNKRCSMDLSGFEDPMDRKVDSSSKIVDATVPFATIVDDEAEVDECKQTRTQETAKVEERNEEVDASFETLEKIKVGVPITQAQAAARPQDRRYSLTDLFELRKAADQSAATIIHCAEVYKECAWKKSTLPIDEPRVIKLRNQPENANDKTIVKYHQDLDVPEHRVFDAYNLGLECKWPHVITYCKKVAGVEPLAVRMCRRHTPPTCMIMLASDEDAEEFERRIPEMRDFALKGRTPRFARRSSLTAEGARRMSLLPSTKLGEGSRKLSILEDVKENSPAMEAARRQSLWPSAKLAH